MATILSGSIRLWEAARMGCLEDGQDISLSD
jgi:hypothetical protein